MWDNEYCDCLNHLERTNEYERIQEDETTNMLSYFFFIQSVCRIRRVDVPGTSWRFWLNISRYIDEDPILPEWVQWWTKTTADPLWTTIQTGKECVSFNCVPEYVVSLTRFEYINTLFTNLRSQEPTRDGPLLFLETQPSKDLPQTTQTNYRESQRLDPTSCWKEAKLNEHLRLQMNHPRRFEQDMGAS